MNDLSARAGWAAETVSLSEAKALIRALAHRRSLVLLSAPGLGKSEIVRQAAVEAGLPCRSVLGTQIAPEDVSGIPKIVGERSVFCPPRVLLPETPEPFCLFLDELPACAPDMQKAFHSLLLDRRLGEHELPQGSWVVAAGNRLEDRAQVRTLSSALVNRVLLLQLRLDVREWIRWARGAFIHADVLAFIAFMPEALMRPVPLEPVPFSTPRAWAALSEALELAEAAGICGPQQRRALAFGCVSAADAAIFCAMAENSIGTIRPPLDYLQRPELLPGEDAARWLVLSGIRSLVAQEESLLIDTDTINRFLMAVPADHRFALMIGLVERWSALGAAPGLVAAFRDATGV
ncbi:MAG: AAA family ATPase [Alphaproteobacteria bacterium]|nr:AAA family ATPase [Alphaproteobacteria bacterium]